MAATNFTPIILYHTTTASAAPTAGNLNNGELAINITDGKLFYKDNGGVVQVIATKGTGTIGGSTTQVQYNNAGALAGSANFTFNGTTATINTLNLTNALGTTFGGTGLNAYTTGDLVYASGTNTLAKLGIGSAGQVLTSSGSAPQWSNLSSLGVTSLSFGTTGLTPSSATQGAITVAGTLATTNGGTGLTSFTANRVFYASSTSAIGQSANLTFDGTTLTAANFTDSSLTSGRVTYATTGGNLTDSANLLYSGTDLTVYGITVGRGAGAVATNTAVGASALNNNTTGPYNQAVGVEALRYNTDGIANTALGAQAAITNTSGGRLVALGNSALYANTTGSYNTAVGVESLRSNTTASNNTAVGYQAGYYITTGSKNTILGGYNGNQGGLDIRTASNQIVLSDGDGNPRGYHDATNWYFPSVDAQTTGGAANVNVGTNGVLRKSTSSLKYKRDVQDATHGLAKVLQLRPVTYKSKSALDGETVYGGLIAEEVHDAGLTEFVMYAEDGTPDALAYANMVSLAFKAIQELKAEFDAYKAAHP